MIKSPCRGSLLKGLSGGAAAEAYITKDLFRGQGRRGSISAVGKTGLGGKKDGSPDLRSL